MNILVFWFKYWDDLCIIFLKKSFNVKLIKCVNYGLILI